MNGRRELAWALAVALAVAAPGVWLAASGVRTIEEDGFYYLKIAQHVAAGHGSTFDGLHPTNGYHPLWLLMVAPVFTAGLSPAAAMAVVTVMQALLAGLAAALLYLAARTRLSAPASAAAALLWALLVQRVALSGVEFALTSALVAAIALALARAADPSDGRIAPALGLGLLLALAVLARIDNVLLAAAVVADRAWRGRVARPRQLLALAAPVMVVGAGYLLLNALLFDSAVPVSGLAKRAWSAHLLQADAAYASGGWLLAKAVHLLHPLRHPLGAGMPALLLGTVPPLIALLVRRPLAVRLRPLIVFAALQPLAYGLAYHGHYSYAPWYYAAQPLLGAMMAAAAVDALARRTVTLPAPAPWLPAATAVAAVLGLAGQGWAMRNGTPSAEGPLYVAARWAGANLGPGARVGTWNAGAIAYLSGRDVVNLDGVVNTAAFFRSEQYDLCSYWRRTGITHLVDVFEPGAGSTMAGATLPVSTYYARCTGSLELLWSQPIAGNPGWPKAFRIRPAAP